VVKREVADTDAEVTGTVDHRSSEGGEPAEAPEQREQHVG
jgi:hypothetical protein